MRETQMGRNKEGNINREGRTEIEEELKLN
jgi:hypothetical protein